MGLNTLLIHCKFRQTYTQFLHSSVCKKGSLGDRYTLGSISRYTPISHNITVVLPVLMLCLISDFSHIIYYIYSLGVE